MVRTKTTENILQFTQEKPIRSHDLGGYNSSVQGEQHLHNINHDILAYNQRSTSHNDLIEHFVNENTYSATLKDGTLNNFEKLEKLIQTSRSNYESDESYQVGTDFAGGELSNKLGENSIYNTYSVNKNKKLNTADKKDNSSGSKLGFFSTTTTDRSYGIQIKHIEKVDNRASPAGHNQFNNTSSYNRNMTKTPKQNKPRVVAYSPRSNIGYYFNEKIANNIKDNKEVSRDNSFSKEGKHNFNSDEKQVKKRKHNSYMNNLIISSTVKLAADSSNNYNRSINDKKVLSSNILNSTIKKNRSVDRRIFENKTNAQTKISVGELLSFKKNEKGRIVNTNTGVKEKNNSTITNHHENAQLGNSKAKSNFFNIKYV
jgi:hypothetical protein